MDFDIILVLLVLSFFAMFLWDFRSSRRRAANMKSFRDYEAVLLKKRIKFEMDFAKGLRELDEAQMNEALKKVLTMDDKEEAE